MNIKKSIINKRRYLKIEKLKKKFNTNNNEEFIYELLLANKILFLN